METKNCKSKKCQRPLPEGYKHRYCENCRNEQIKQIKDIGKATLGLVIFAGGTALTVVTRGKIKK